MIERKRSGEAGRGILRRALCAAVVLGAAATAHAGEVRRDLETPMADGVVLRADLYLPEEPGPHPVIVIRTPYNKLQNAPYGEHFAKRGFAALIQDVRGKHASGGEFDFWIHERSDSSDTLRWIAKRDWCDGNVGVWGNSYPAFIAMLMAADDHPAMKAAFAVSGPPDPWDIMFPGGALHSMAILPWTLLVTASSEQFYPPQWKLPPTKVFDVVPLADAAKRAGAPASDWELITKHANSATFYRGAGLHGRLNEVRVPVFFLSGWHDFIARHTTKAYRDTRAAWEASRGSSPHRLLVGPWRHDQVGNYPDAKVGDVDFGPELVWSREEYLDLAAEWFNAHLRGQREKSPQNAAVRYFLMGANEWIDADNWPPADVSEVAWHFGPASSARTGGLSPDAGTAERGAMNFEYDPSNPVPTVGGVNVHFFLSNLGPLDQRRIGEREDVLRFTSEPLAEPVQIVGRVEVVLFASTDGPDTDFTAKLVSVRPDGYERIIEDGIVRARFRDGMAKSEPLSPGETVEYRIDLGSTAIEVPAGHRLRVDISSSNFPKYDRNANSMTPPLEARSFRKAKQTVFFGPDHPSRLILPVREAN